MNAGELLVRRSESLCLEYLAAFRVLVISGPRQAGKTTLMRQLLQAGGELRSLDEPSLLAAARTDPAGFVLSEALPLMVDEVQRAGNPLVLAVKARVDERPDRGQYVLAGSTRFLTEPSLGESLAGRAAVVQVWPFSQGELQGRRESFVDLAFTEPDRWRSAPPLALTRSDYLQRLVAGGFPEPCRMGSSRLRRAWFANYVAAVTERDIREMARVREPNAAATVLRSLAAQTSQLLVTANVAARTGLTRATVDRYVDLLEAVMLVHRLPAWSRSPVSRAVKHAKVHMVDTGLAAHLQGVSAAGLARPGAPEVGPLLETFVVNEIMKQVGWAERPVRLSHYRDRDGAEVDLLLEDDRGDLVAIGVKAALSVSAADARHLRMLQGRVGQEFRHGFVVYLGERALSLGPGVTALPLGLLWQDVVRTP